MTADPSCYEGLVPTAIKHSSVFDRIHRTASWLQDECSFATISLASKSLRNAMASETGWVELV